MADMVSILEDLNKEVGIVGSLVVTQDGIVVASALGPDLDDDTVAALASNAIISAKKGMAMLGDDNCYRFALTAAHGKMVFEDIGIAYLVVVTHQNISLSQTQIAIKGAAYKIRHRRAD
jgi:predicted regulator of Ras-like GTPase activity (Roadblock/LC7/MglB family)